MKSKYHTSKLLKHKRLFSFLLALLIAFSSMSVGMTAFAKTGLKSVESDFSDEDNAYMLDGTYAVRYQKIDQTVRTGMTGLSVNIKSSGTQSSNGKVSYNTFLKAIQADETYYLEHMFPDGPTASEEKKVKQYRVDFEKTVSGYGDDWKFFIDLDKVDFGTPVLTLKNLVMYYGPGSSKNQLIDLKVSINNAKTANGGTASGKVEETGDPARQALSAPENKGKKYGYAALLINKQGHVDVGMYGPGCATLTYEFYKAGTNTPYKMQTNMTYGDIDVGQAVRIGSAANVQTIYMGKDTNLVMTEDDGSYFFTQNAKAAADGDHSNIPQDAVGVVVDSTHWYTTFWTNHYRKTSEATGSFNNGIQPSDNAGDGGWSYYKDNGYYMAKPIIPEPPTKSVSDSNESGIKNIRNTLDSIYENYTYSVWQHILPNYSPAQYFSSFVMSDTFEDILSIQKAEVYKNDTLCNSSQFNIKINGQTVTAAAAKSFLNSADFYGAGYELRVTVKINTEKYSLEQIKASKWFRSDTTGEYLSIPNTGKVVIDDNPSVTNETTTLAYLPSLAVTKDVQPYEFQVGDTMPYTITVRQTAPNAVAEHVVVTDVDFPAGFSIDSSSYAVSGIDRPYSISNADGGFKFTTDQLKYGETVTIQFNAKVDKSLNGKVVPNTVKASADFCEDKTASTSAYINSPKMHVDKTVTKHTGKYNVGDKVNYKITLTQINEGCFMRNIWLDDVLETKGVTFDRSSLMIMNADHDELVKGVDYNIKWWYEGDEITGFALQFIGKYANMGYVNHPQTPAASDARGVATGAYSNLNLIDKIIVTYSTTIENADLAGKEIKNTASSPATPNTNGDKIRDDDSIPSGGDSDNEVVTPQTPVVEVEKTANKTEFNPGDTGSYTVTLKNTTVNTTATKIVFKDSFDKAGIAYQTATVKVTLDGKDITKNCKTTLSEDGLSMTVATNTDLPYGSVMQLTYDVQYGADMEAGTDITNKVTAVPENAPSVDADYTVHLINPPDPEEPAQPQLNIQKAVDKTSVTVGESANYTVTVSETVKDATAHQVVIEDALDTEGVAIQAQSIKVALDGKDITDSCTITVAENKLSYTIETHQDLTDSNKIVVTYTVDFKDAELAGKNVTNVAVASSPDTPPVTTTVDVPVEVPAELVMDKSVDKETYKTGDILHYTIITTAKNGAVKNVVITDTVDSKNLEYSKDIKVLLGETDITDSCKITYSDYSFIIETGKDLADGETITVTYSGKAVGNQNIVNTATATGDNVDEQTDTCTVTPVLPPAIQRTPGGGTSPHTGVDDLPLFVSGGLGAAGLSILLYLAIKKKHARRLAKAAIQ